MNRRLSPEAEELLAYAFSRGGQSPVSHDDHVVGEAVRAGLVELVSIGVDEPTIVLTPAGLDHCKPAAATGHFDDPKVARPAV